MNLTDAHNYRSLLKRWRAVSREAGLKMVPVSRFDGSRIYEITSPAFSKDNGIYLSAGIHGDEVGGVQGLLCWAEKNVRNLASLPLLLFPCLNPWGMEGNSRFCQTGDDLNRSWGGNKSDLTTAIQNRIQNMKFHLILNLHEDYDANGAYLYELIRGSKSKTRGEGILQSLEGLIPRDGRKVIEKKKVRNGIIRPRPRNFLAGELPEALYLFQNHTDHSYTLETPSELDLGVRVNAQVRMIEAALTL